MMAMVAWLSQVMMTRCSWPPCPLLPPAPRMSPQAHNGEEGWMVPGNEVLCVPCGTQLRSLEIGDGTLPMDPMRETIKHGGRRPVLDIPRIGRQGSGVLPLLHLLWGIASPGINCTASNRKFRIQIHILYQRQQPLRMASQRWRGGRSHGNVSRQ